MLFHMASTERSRMGFVLAGGKSSRMNVDPGTGSAGHVDKAFVDFEGQTLLDRALILVSSACDHVAVVGDPKKFAQQKIINAPLVVADIFPGCGPLGGIHAALVNSSSELNLMLAVDMPFVSRELLAFLLAAAEDNDATVIVPRGGRGLQPLCAVYRRSFAGVAERALRSGIYKVGAAFADVSVRVVDQDELAAAGFSERNFFNINTPQDRGEAEGQRA